MSLSVLNRTWDVTTPLSVSRSVGREGPDRHDVTLTTTELPLESG